jgi:hypothetical protein
MSKLRPGRQHDHAAFPRRPGRHLTHRERSGAVRSRAELPGGLVCTPVPRPRCRQDGESGLRDYDVDYKVGESGDWTAWLTPTTQAQAPFVGEADQSHVFPSTSFGTGQVNAIVSRVV